MNPPTPFRAALVQTAIIAGLASIFITSSVQAQPDLETPADPSGRQRFVKWAQTHAFPLQNSEVPRGDSDLQPLKSSIGGARVVALGEPAHGIHETLALRNRLFRFLVEHGGFNVIALEAGLAESHRIADFVAGGPGSAEQVAGDLTLGDPAVDDVELLRWMREYNASPGHPRKVKLYGMDMQLIGLPGATTPSHAALDQALAYLDRVDPAPARQTRAILAPYLDRLSVAKYASLSSLEHDGLSAALDDLIALFERQRPAFITVDSKAAYDWAYRNALVARQTDRLVRVQPPETPGKIPPEAWRTMNARDAAMAENVTWILEREGPQARVLVYAHNAHVKNAVTEGGVWSAFARPPNATGQYLRLALGHDLMIIGTSFAPAAAAPLDGLDLALSEVGVPRFFLDLRTTPRDPLVTAWLTARRPMQANQVTFMTLSPSTAFDALLFIDGVTPARRIKLK